MSTTTTTTAATTKPLLNVIWASDWDDDLDEPTGVMRDLGVADPDHAWLAIFRGHLDAFAGGWGEGGVYLLDGDGVPVDPGAPERHRIRSIDVLLPFSAN